MATPHCFASLQLCALRMARLESSGHPAEGSGNGYVSDGMTKLDVGIELNEGDDFELKNGCGALIAAFKQPDRIKRLNLTLELGILDVEILELAVGWDLFRSGGESIGGQMPPVVGTDNNQICLEAYSKAMDGDEQAVPALTTPNAAYFHWVFPRVSFTHGDFTLENELSTFPLEGKGEENSSITANGPFNDWDAAVAADGGITRVGGFFFDDVLPTADCGYIAVPTAPS